MVLYTGFLTHAGGIPKAWPLLKFPADYLVFPMARPPTLVVLGLGIACALSADLFRKRLPARFVNAFQSNRAAFYLLSAWVVLGYLAFIFLMPAVSFVTDRMTLPMLGPGILLAAMSFAAVARMITGMSRPVTTTVLASLAFLGFLLAVGGVQKWPKESLIGISRQVEYTIDWLRDRKFKPGTRIYASPNKHLVFSVYTGIPVQNIAPVRKSFLDNYDRDVMVLDCVVPFQTLPPRFVIAAAEKAGKSLAELEALELSWLINKRAVVLATMSEVRQVEPRPMDVPLPVYLEPLVAEQVAYTAKHLSTRNSPARGCPAIFRGYTLQDWTDWWPVYFYRFVHPENRSRANLNYAERARGGRAIVLPVGWRVYDLPASGTARN